MNSILSDLYHGELRPNEHGYPPTPTSASCSNPSSRTRSGSGMENNLNKVTKHGVTAVFNFVISDEDIDEIMSAALAGGITYWCGRAKVVGEYLGEYASEQISRGGVLKLYDIEEPKAVYELTLDWL